MDGLEERRNVFVIAATNRPDIIDPAMLRPGRLDKLLYVPLPTSGDRLSILKTLTRKIPLDKDVIMKTIALDKRGDGFSGADLAALVREAQMSAIKNSQEVKDLTVTAKDFMNAFGKVFASVSKKDEKTYLELEKSLRNSRSHLN
mmetsp:Transcript_32839/g.32066  ORF Transcript_32839/g.32066 Transcript_32839/m.32066 type:complete len:145 (+) Transcript_32839:1269-1703(+)